MVVTPTDSLTLTFRGASGVTWILLPNKLGKGDGGWSNVGSGAGKAKLVQALGMIEAAQG